MARLCGSERGSASADVTDAGALSSERMSAGAFVAEGSLDEASYRGRFNLHHGPMAVAGRPMPTIPTVIDETVAGECGARRVVRRRRFR
ncbi:hypothetical protein BDI4_870027 [Burkholderia diffusa]|nr:hypothetical protein BDI4_870027 [Burkholderia diffusa]